MRLERIDFIRQLKKSNKKCQYRGTMDLVHCALSALHSEIGFIQYSFADEYPHPLSRSEPDLNDVYEIDNIARACIRLGRVALRELSQNEHITMLRRRYLALCRQYEANYTAIITYAEQSRFEQKQ